MTFDEIERKHIEETYHKPYDEVRKIAGENLVKAGCPENQIDFVLEHGGIYQAYKNDLDCFQKFPEHAVMYLTTD